MNNQWKQRILHNNVANEQEPTQQAMLDPTLLTEHSGDLSLVLDLEALPGMRAKAGVRAGQTLRDFLG